MSSSETFAIVKESTLMGIANAIRAKAGTNAQMHPSEMADAVTGIKSGARGDGWECGVEYDTTYTSGYYTLRGVETALSGWNLSNHVKCAGVVGLIFSEQMFLQLCEFFDANGTYISAMGEGKGLMCYVPSNAATFRLSVQDASVSSVRFFPIAFKE